MKAEAKKIAWWETFVAVLGVNANRCASVSWKITSVQDAMLNDAAAIADKAVGLFLAKAEAFERLERAQETVSAGVITLSATLHWQIRFGACLAGRIRQGKQIGMHFSHSIAMLAAEKAPQYITDAPPEFIAMCYPLEQIDSQPLELWPWENAESFGCTQTAAGTWMQHHEPIGRL